MEIETGLLFAGKDKAGTGKAGKDAGNNKARRDKAAKDAGNNRAGKDRVKLGFQKGTEGKEKRITEGAPEDSHEGSVEASTKEISLLEMFFLFVKIGMMTIGGGYVMIPLLQEEFVAKRNLMSVKEFCDIIAIAQTGPGGVAINASTVVGYQLRGIVGSIVATIGTVMPSFLVIVLLAAWLLQEGNAERISGFMSGATPAVVGLLITASWSLGKEVVEDKMGVVLAVAGFIAVVVLHLHPVLVIIGAGILGFVYYRTRIEPEPGASCDLPQVEIKTTDYER